MWLPTPIYERIPQFWFLLGLLFMTSGTYLGFDYSLSFLYFGVGFGCCLWGIWIFTTRARTRFEARKSQREADRVEQAKQAEQQPGDEVNQGVETTA